MDAANAIGKTNTNDLLTENVNIRNARSVFHAMILRKTQSKKMMHYVNKQNFCVSYKSIRKQSKKLKNDILNGESGTTPLLKGISNHSSINYVNEKSKSISLHFDKLQFVSAQRCWKVGKSHPGFNEEISPLSIGKQKGPPSFTDFVDGESKYLVWYPLVEVCPRTD